MALNPGYLTVLDGAGVAQRISGFWDDSFSPQQFVAEHIIASADPTTASATIASSASLSGVIDLASQRLHRIVMPAAWDAAFITFQSSYDGTNFNNLYNDSGEYTLSSAGASRAIVVDQSLFYGIRYMKIRSGTSGTPVNQTASRSLTLVTVPR